MINFLSVLKGLLSLADIVAKICHDKQLLDAGEYKAIAENNSNALKKIQAANLARSSVGTGQSHDDVVLDPFNRDGA